MTIAFNEERLRALPAEIHKAYQAWRRARNPGSQAQRWAEYTELRKELAMLRAAAAHQNGGRKPQPTRAALSPTLKRQINRVMGGAGGNGRR
jgi:ribosomal protein L29